MLCYGAHDTHICRRYYCLQRPGPAAAERGDHGGGGGATPAGENENAILKIRMRLEVRLAFYFFDVNRFYPKTPLS